jgi:hypothetical protein
MTKKGEEVQKGRSGGRRCSPEPAASSGSIGDTAVSGYGSLVAL